MQIIVGAQWFGMVRHRRAELMISWPAPRPSRLPECARPQARPLLAPVFSRTFQALKILAKINIANHERPACTLDDEALAFEPLQGLA